LKTLTKSLIEPLAVLALALATAVTGFGQATSSLRGTVYDGNNAVIAGAVVTLTASDSPVTRKVVTGSIGEYQFVQVVPGKYSVKAEKPGFAVSQNNDILLQVNTPASLEIHMEVGQVSSVVNVEATVATINTTDASIGNAFTETQVRQLPLQTRNVVELLSIQPGVTPTGEVLGARRDQNNITLDGVDVNDNQNSGINPPSNGLANGSNANGVANEAGFNAAVPVPLDSVQEFRVTVGGQGANQGRSSGGQVTLITKSGTNQFHGSAYEYNRNTATTANNWFSNRAGIDREALVRNQFGVSLGGRIIRDRLFFFANFEDRLDRSASGVNRTVPTASLAQGILTFRTNTGGIQTLTPAEVKAVDPLHQGFNPAMKTYLSQFPAGNDPALGSDGGLNFSGYRFNAPLKRDDRAYVAKMDFHPDKAGKHVVSVRGTLFNAAQDVPTALAQFPGQPSAAKLLNNSKGISGSYTTVLSSSLVNVTSIGFTRLGLEQTGTSGDALSFDGVSSVLNYGNTARGYSRRLPTTNIVDDLNWTKGKHTITTGVNFRFINIDRSSLVNSFPSYGFSRNTLFGLGNDITNLINGYIQQRSGDSGLKLSDSANVVRGMGNLLGIINQYSGTYQYQRDGSAIPFGQAAMREFGTHEYEGYVQDSWRARRDLTLTFGLRYSNYSVPYEKNGIQVGTTVGVDKYFAERVGAALSGTPGYAIPDANLTYALNGSANGKPSWYGRDKNNFGPRFSFAYSPDKGDSLFTKIFGKGSVLRGGMAMVYDRFGSDLITEFDRTGSPGLASSVTQPNNTDFTTSARYGATLPALPASQGGAFPYTPPTIVGGFGSGVGISPDLVAPYSIVMNASYARELKGKMTIEVGYAGRLSRKNLLQADYFQPLTTFKDSKSGQDWTQASAVIRKLYDSGVTPAQVAKNPSLIPNVPFFENVFPGLKDAYIKGSASANYFDALYNQNDGSDLDALNQMDRVRTSQFPNCVSAFGCNTFFANQNAGLVTWVNAGNANYHGGMLSLRRGFTNGIAFDFNYTLSHSIDNSSGTESGAGSGGAVLQDAFHPGAFRGSSDFDIRHNISANGLVELPFGKNKMFLANIPSWANQIVGGWELSTVARYRSGLPTTISNSGIYPTNYLNSALAIVAPGATVNYGTGYDQKGNPSLFGNTSSANSFTGQYAGTTGTRAIVRLDGFKNFDIAASKVFHLPWEGHQVRFRAEAFNAFNNVNFYNPVLRLDRTSTFGEYQNASPSRVMQFALRYEF
jgi:hypothetical protein